MSLRTGGPIGTVISPIINPTNLKIEGWLVDDYMQRQRGVLLSQDIRDIIVQGFVVNDHESISDPAELVRLKPIMDLNFEVIGKVVVTQNKHRIGKIKDYALEKDTFFIQKLYTEQPLLRSLNGSSAIVDRSSIVEVNNHKIIVSDATKAAKPTVVSQPAQPAINPAQP